LPYLCTCPRVTRSAPVSLSVLLIDDDPAFRRLARRTLARTPMTVVGEANTAASGASAARELKPDVVLVDVGLPDGDGITLARELAGLPWGPRIVLTSVDPDAADEVERVGAHGFIPKHELPGRGIQMMLDGA
jgi:DNA-binding NarL/FixJ family response regulator